MRQSRYSLSLPIGLIGIVLSATAAASAEPTAIIEDVSAPASQLQAMDYLYEGDTVTLAPGEKITISYLMSCAIERISGGTAKIAIGSEKSKVTGKGRVKRKFVECGGTVISVSGRQSDAAAGVVVRGGDNDGENRPQVTVYSQHPVIKLSTKANRIKIERLGRKNVQDIEASSRIVDLAVSGIKLEPGGVYRASAGKMSVIFKVANSARATSRNLISRLVEL